MRPLIPSSLLSLLSFVLFLPVTAVAHDGWIEISPSIVEKGQSVTIALMQGNHSNVTDGVLRFTVSAGGK